MSSSRRRGEDRLLAGPRRSRAGRRSGRRLPGAAVARGGKRLLDTAVDAGLDRLSGAVARRLGREPESDLARDPRSPAVQAYVVHEIEAAALRDPDFARELKAL